MPIKAGDIGNIPDTGGPVAPGRYAATVTEAVELAANDGTLQWKLTLRLASGRTINDFLRWSEAAMIRGKIACEALGVDLSNPEAVVSAGDLVGKSCEVDVIHKPRQSDGRVFANVDFRGYHKLTGPAPAATAAPTAKAAVTPLFS